MLGKVINDFNLFFIYLKKLSVKYEIGGIELVAKITHAFLAPVRSTRAEKTMLICSGD